MAEYCSFAANAGGVAQPLHGFSLIGHSGFAEDLPKSHELLLWFFYMIGLHRLIL
jgi:hypothetical protein